MKARAKLIQRDPFFGAVALGLRLKALTDFQAATSRIKTMGTDSVFLVYNLDFVAYCTIKQLMASIAHEAAHVADQVIADPQRAPIPKEPGQIYALCAALSQRAKESTIDAIITYASRLSTDPNAGAEFSVALVCDSVRKDPQNLAQGQVFQDWTSEHHDILI